MANNDIKLVLTNGYHILRGNTRAYLRDNVVAVLRDDARAELRDNASVHLFDDAFAVLYGDSTATLYDNSEVELHDHAKIIADYRETEIEYKKEHDELLNFTIGKRQLYLYRSVIIGCTNGLNKPSDQTELFTADADQYFIVDEPLGDVLKKLKGK
jgi:hypothetical protein